MIKPRVNAVMQRLGHVEREHHPTKVLGLVLLLSLMVMMPPLASADSSDAYAHPTLHGLQGVGVVVERLDPDAERDGLTQEQIWTEVGLRLRTAGIRVLTREEWLKTPGLPYLYVRVATRKTPHDFYAIAIHVELWQAVLLVRDPTSATIAPTWKTKGMIGSVGADRIRTIREAVGGDVDEFIKDYLAMNPRLEQGAIKRLGP